MKAVLTALLALAFLAGTAVGYRFAQSSANERITQLEADNSTLAASSAQADAKAKAVVIASKTEDPSPASREFAKAIAANDAAAAYVLTSAGYRAQLDNKAAWSGVTKTQEDGTEKPDGAKFFTNFWSLPEGFSIVYTRYAGSFDSGGGSTTALYIWVYMDDKGDTASTWFMFTTGPDGMIAGAE